VRHRCHRTPLPRPRRLPTEGRLRTHRHGFGIERHGRTTRPIRWPTAGRRPAAWVTAPAGRHGEREAPPAAGEARRRLPVLAPPAAGALRSPPIALRQTMPWHTM